MESIVGDELDKMSEVGGQDERILVSVRLRPLNTKEISKNDVSDWECINDNTLIYRNTLSERSMNPHGYTFDRVFGSDSPTKTVYDEAAKEVALSVVSGINASIFAYGQTSSGKTFTMSGITEYTVEDIYDYVQRHVERTFVLKFSAMEIYNEAVRDLLSTDHTPLRLLDDPERGTVVDRLTEETLTDLNHLKELLSFCEGNTIESSAREFMGKDNSSTLAASVDFVDLAGSERASQALSAGTRLKEGSHINRSLLTLGTVVRKLSKGRNVHVPYRDSKLTRILQSSLGGNARTAIICTISPARSHTEQSRNTLLFASCAKEVATNAHVNVVMSDKALVKHLQRELARLESELKGLGSSSPTGDSAALLREKDLQIEKVEFNKHPKLLAPIALAVEPVSDPHLDVGFESTSIPHSYNEPRTENPEDHFLIDGSSPRFSTISPRFVGPDPYKGWEGIKQGGEDDFEELCKDVRCIELEDSSTNSIAEPDAITREEDEGMFSLRFIEDGPTTDQTLLSAPRKEDEKLTKRQVKFTYDNMEQKFQDEQKTINCVNSPLPDPPSRWQEPEDLSMSRKTMLAKSRSCRASLMNGSFSPSPRKAEKNHNTPPSGSEKDFSGKLRDIQRKFATSNYDSNTSLLSRQSSRTSERSDLTDDSRTHPVRTSSQEDDTSIQSFVAGLKKRTKIQYENKLVDNQAQAGLKTDGSEKTVKGLGSDPVRVPHEMPSSWPLEFERQQMELIELWQICHVSLVHRTYFFLLFKGDPSDSVYMQVERRRLSFLKDLYSQRNFDKIAVKGSRDLTPASSMRALRREREMLCKQMNKKLSVEERERIFLRWSIGLKSKQRRVQLARLLWTDTKDMDHVIESADIVAKLVGLPEPSLALKEMFTLSFTPQKKSRRSYSWRGSSATAI
ncbi:hypothetical protein IFM89_034163 [Coptis chinensis]|uniref:Kinesin-like protein n=1 Tax=Coptis chinensis TaxID=261450 RepID=A0A835HRY9_9MAGN|nr:hypothetical protein IFM89_034163 [Coptis chinensis]